MGAAPEARVQSAHGAAAAGRRRAAAGPEGTCGCSSARREGERSRIAVRVSDPEWGSARHRHGAKGGAAQARPGRLPLGDLPHRSEEHTSELQSRGHLVCRLLLEKKKHKSTTTK